MAARKLQQEMDRVFKRVSEGVTQFDAIYEKLEQSTNQSQKEKLEQDLKREIKKLQRLRDQIKTWMGSNEIKDKKQLVEQRKLIETEMERFKACEKEMKTKAFSKEGLTNAKQDPREKEKQDTCNFLQEMLEELERQCETLEAESESVASTMKRGKKDTAKAERISEIENTLERHKWHQEKMEVMMRMIDNDTLATESVNDLREDIKYYVESNQDADFAEDEEIYDELNLDEDDENLVEIEYKEEGNSLEDLAVDKQGTTPEPASKEDKKKEKEKQQQAAAVAPSTVSMKPATAPPKPEMKYSSAAQSSIPQGLSPLPPPPPKSESTPTPTTAPAALSSSTAASSNPSTPAKPASAATTTAAAAAAAAATTTATAPWAAAAGAIGDDSKKEKAVSAAPSPSPTPPRLSSPSPAYSSPTTLLTQAQFPQAPQVVLPPGLQDLVSSFDAARKRIGNPPSITTISKLLGTSYLNCPDSTLADRPYYYHPESPFPTPSYYPQEPIRGLDEEDILAKMDVDTLFYIFYYRQGTYQQYVAAKELKKRSWRFHKRFLTWFQRHEEPKVITNEYEQGTYRYFDFEGLWLQRRKSNFKFEYQYLEDDVE